MEEQSLIIPSQDRYDDSLALAGYAADKVVRETEFERYHELKSPGTRASQKNDLALFSKYLACMNVDRSPDDLFFDAHSWKGINASIIEGFRQWLYYKQEDAKGYKPTSVNRYLSTIRQYCRMAYKSGVLSHEEWLYIKEIKTHSHAESVNIDHNREEKGITPRVGIKKEYPVAVEREDFETLKETKTEHLLYRSHDMILEQRDGLLLCLLGEHGLRVGEVAGLNIGSIDLRHKKLLITTFKRHTKDTLDLLPDTQEMAELYLPLMPTQKDHPLFLGYQGKRITRHGIARRVRELGRLMGLEGLSPHDLRHYWTKDWFERGESLNVIQRFGRWRSGAMPLHYAKEFGVEATKPKILKEKNKG